MRLSAEAARWTGRVISTVPRLSSMVTVEPCEAESPEPVELLSAGLPQAPRASPTAVTKDHAVTAGDLARHVFLI